MSLLVSIIIPTFRRGNNGYLKRAIDSILLQTYPNFELIIIDDGSTDNTQMVIQEYDDSRIKNIRHQENCGIHAKRLNEGIRLSQGSYIAFMFDDDFWLPSHLQIMTENLQKLPPTYGMVFGLTLSMHAQTKNIEILGGDYSPERLEQGNCIGNQAVLIRKGVITDVGGYDEHPGMTRLCDWDLWLRVVKAGYLIYKIPVVTSINEYALPDSLRETVPVDLNFVYQRMQEERLEYLRGLVRPAQNLIRDNRIPPEVIKMGHLLKGKNEPAVYFIYNGYKYLIPSEEVFNYFMFKWEKVNIISEEELESIPDGGVLNS